MSGWIIAGAIVAAILILLMTSVTVRFEYSDGLRLKINWLFLNLVQIPAKTKKMKRRDKKAEKDVKSAAVDEEKLSGETTDVRTGGAEEKKDSPEPKSAPDPEKSPGKKAKKQKGSPKDSADKLTLKDIRALVKLVWDSLSKPLKRLLKATRIYDFRLYIVVGGEDAAKAAIRFGEVNIAAGSALAFLDGNFTLKKPDYYITCDFLSEETRAECSFTAKLTVIAALAFLFWLAGRAVKNYLAREDAAAAVGKLRK